MHIAHTSAADPTKAQLNMTIEQAVVENCTFPSDFTDADKSKFGNEVSAAAGRFLPNCDVEELIDDVTATKKQITVKYGKTVTKSGKDSPITYNFRVFVWLSIAAMRKLQKLTGYSAPVDLSQNETFWKTWKRAEVESDEPAPANKPEEKKPEGATQSAE